MRWAQRLNCVWITEVEFTFCVHRGWGKSQFPPRWLSGSSGWAVSTSLSRCRIWPGVGLSWTRGTLGVVSSHRLLSWVPSARHHWGCSLLELWQPWSEDPFSPKRCSFWRPGGFTDPRLPSSEEGERQRPGNARRWKKQACGGGHERAAGGFSWQPAYFWWIHCVAYNCHLRKRVCPVLCAMERPRGQGFLRWGWRRQGMKFSPSWWALFSFFTSSWQHAYNLSVV